MRKDAALAKGRVVTMAAVVANAGIVAEEIFMLVCVAVCLIDLLFADL